MWNERRLTGNGTPRCATIPASIKSRLFADHAHIKSRSGLPLFAAFRVRQHKAERTGIGSRGKRLDFSPGRRIIGAAPETRRARTEINDIRAVGINGKPFANGTPVFVTSQLKGKIGTRKGFSAIARTQDGSVCRPRLQVGSCREINAVRVGGISGNTFDPEKIPVLCAEPIGQRHPAFCRRVPAIRPPDVRAGKEEVGSRLTVNETGNKTPTYHLDIAPQIGSGCGGGQVCKDRAGKINS